MRNRAFLYQSVTLIGLTAFSGAANAQNTPAAVTAEAADGPGTDIVVFGRGQTRQVTELRAADIAAAVPGTSPLQILAKLPSVNFQSASPLGTNEWSTRISVRGFDQSRLGFTLDDVPLGDMSYANFNGLHISRAIASENIGRTELSQGAGALSTASSSNLGGTIQFYSMDPSEKFGVDTEATYGSENAWHLFGRVNTGDLGGGIKGYVSGSYLDSPKWKGAGTQRAWTLNSKIVIPVGTKGTIKAFANYSDWKDDDYIDMWPEMLARKGYDSDYLRYDWKTAYAVAANYNTKYCASYAGYSTDICGDDAYYDGYGLRKDLLLGANIDYALNDSISFKLTPYYHHDHGIGTWWAPQAEFGFTNPTGAPFSVRSTEYKINREGVTGGVTWVYGRNTLQVGGWYEHNNFEESRQYYALDNTQAGSSIGKLEWPQNPYRYDFDYKFKINTYQYNVQDTLQLTDKFKITGGWKGLEVKVDDKFVQGDAATWGVNGSLKSKDMFIPQVGANYMLTDQFEVFADYAENMRAFTTDPFITSPAQFAALKASNVKPETSWTAEGGLRVHVPHFEGSIAGYHVKFDNRLFAVTSGTAVQSIPSVLNNVGGITTNGFELAGTYHVTHALSFYGSYSYTDAKYDDDVFTNPTDGSTPTLVVNTGGKHVVDQPKNLINGEIAYDDGTFSARFHGNYQSKRFATYSNDLSFSGRALFDLNLGYAYHGDGFLNGMDIQLNATNLFDKKYVATIGETGGYRNYFTGPNANPYVYFLVGAPRQVFVTIRKKF
jgi:iron complex outermembrane receptor protein